MPRQRTRQPEKILGDMTHPDSFGTLHVGFLNWLKDRNYSAATIQHRRRYLNDFIDWAEQRSYTRPAELTRNILERYQRHLAQQMNRFGKPLSFRDQGQRLGRCGPGTAGSSASGTSSTTWPSNSSCPGSVIRSPSTCPIVVRSKRSWPSPIS